MAPADVRAGFCGRGPEGRADGDLDAGGKRAASSGVRWFHWRETMAPAARWVIALVVALVAGAIWMFWKKPDTPPPAAVSLAQAPAAASAAPAPAAPAPAPAPVVAPEPPKPPEPVTVVVFFDFDRSALRSGETAKLDELAAKAAARSGDRVEAVGYADRIGEEPYNGPLSRKRADAVAAYLATKGVDAGRIRAEGKGESDATGGEACKDLGPEHAKNQKLVDCLERDRRVTVVLVAAR
jgi:OOP family OmpA-OmpF porin